MNKKLERTKIGIAGYGAIGKSVCKALEKGIEGFELTSISEISDAQELPAPNVSFETLADQCDLIIECLPPPIVPDLIQHVFAHEKDLILISACSLLINPELLEAHNKTKHSRIIVPSGALIGIDGVAAMKQIGIKSAKIISSKKPAGFAGAPYIEKSNIDLNAITEKQLIFSGNALEAAKGFPANVNVAATLSLAGIGPEKTMVEIWADPNAEGNSHTIDVRSEYSHINARVENMPDPANPKTSVLAAQSIIATLKNMSASLIIV